MFTAGPSSNRRSVADGDRLHDPAQAEVRAVSQSSGTGRISTLHTHWKRASRLTQWVLLGVALLILLRLAMPFVVKSYVTRKLNRTRDYSGRIGDVNLHLWRGGYRIRGIEIQKKGGGVATPLFSARELELSLQWRELFHGAVVGQAIVREPRINIVSGPTDAQTQTGKGERWDQVIESLFPFKFNRVEIAAGEVHFQSPGSRPPVDIYTGGIFATATNLTNTRDITQRLPSGVTARARTIGGGDVDLHLRLNLLEPKPAFEMDCGLTNVDLVALNDFLRAYGRFDVARGKFALYTSVAAGEGNYDGYLKVFFENLDVFAWEKERKKSVLQEFWQAIVGGITTVFKNHPKDRPFRVPDFSDSDPVALCNVKGDMIAMCSR